MNRGEVWHFEFKKPDKARPVIILTRQEMIPLLNTVTVAPITRTLRGVSSEVVLGKADGLKELCVANLHHLMTIPKSGLSRFVTTLSPEKMSQIQAAMLFALGFDDLIS